MSKRTVRVNELMMREISDILHTRYQAEAVYITITSVDVAPDLRNARVFYSVLGDQDKRTEARDLLKRHKGEIRHYLGQRIVLKYLPALAFMEDKTPQQSTDILGLMDELEAERLREETDDEQ